MSGSGSRADASEQAMSSECSSHGMRKIVSPTHKESRRELSSTSRVADEMQGPTASGNNDTLQNTSRGATEHIAAQDYSAWMAARQYMTETQLDSTE